MKLPLKKTVLLILLTAFAYKGSSQESFLSFLQDDLDSTIQAELKRWDIPGLSIGIILNDTIRYNKGFGVTSINTSEKVDEHTLFRIGSLTKAMTCTTVLLAEEREELSIKDKLIKYFPDFHLQEQSVAAVLDLEDFMSGQSGLGAHYGDFFYWKTQKKTEDVVSTLSLFENQEKIRYRFRYNNLAYVVLGEVLEKSSGASWATQIKQHLFEPLKMKHSFPYQQNIPAQLRIAAPHFMEGENTIELPAENIANMGPAGSVLSTSTDMLKWLKALLSLEQDRERVFPDVVLKKIRRPHTLLGYRRSKSDRDQLRFLFYGKGLSISDENRMLHYRHNGGTDGFTSQLLMIPEAQLGVVVLTNSRSHNLAESLVEYIQKVYLQQSTEGHFDTLFHKFKKEQEEEQRTYFSLRDSVQKQKAPLPFDASRLGIYENPGYGTITISKQKNGVNMQFNAHQESVSAHLMHKKEATFHVVFENPVRGYTELTFHEESGKQPGFYLDMDATSYYFQKQP
ncbi:MAG: serine hydrolase domain-containing protein [Bacteroidota bacterium]